MPALNLTDFTIRNIKPPEHGQVTYWDTSLPGFNVRVSQGGSLTYCLVYGSDRRRVSLGRVGVVALKDARKCAKDLLAEYQLSGHKTASPLFKDSRETYLKIGQWKPSTAAENRRLLERHFTDIEDKSLDTVTAADIMAVIDDLIDTPSEAAHAFTAIKSFIRWSAGRGYCADLLASLRKPKTAPPRARLLTDDEMTVVNRPGIAGGWLV